MSTYTDKDVVIYEVTNRTSGVKSYQAAKTAEDACKLAGWLIDDCFVNPQKPKRKPGQTTDNRLLVKINCRTCPFQYAECRQPIGEDCPTRPATPELQGWIMQAAKAHLCPYVGETLAAKDYNLGQKWLPMDQAIRELGDYR